jgi:predicted outer membrane repeat protein
MRQVIITIAAVILAAGTVSAVTHGKTICVDADAAGANNGTSWADAYKFLQDALTDANSSEKPVEIRVAQGVYKPDKSTAEPNGTGDREAAFQLISGVTLKGGYAGFSQPDPNWRDIDLYETILSGDLAGNDLDVNDVWDLWNEPSRAENSYHVVTGSGTDETAVLEGFTITNGYADRVELENQARGGGVYTNSGSPTVMNCAVSGNYGVIGGGMCNVGGNPLVANCRFIMNWSSAGGGLCNMKSSPTVSNCAFSANYGSDGGGVYNERGSPNIINCTLGKNTAQSGGGMYNMNSRPAVTGCTFSANSSMYSGGAIYCRYQSSLTIKNSIIEDNWSNRGGGIFCDGRSSVTIENCVIRGNSVRRGYEGSPGIGGGIFCYDSSITIKDSEISRNRADRSSGGISSVYSELLLVNNSITANEAISLYGPGGCGGISCYGGTTTIINNTILGNRADAYISHAEQVPGEGSGICCSGNLTLISSIIWDNIYPAEDSTVQITHCDIQGGWAGVGNIDAEPCFAEAGYWDPNETPDDANDDFWVDGEYHLKSQAGRWDANDGRWVIDEVTSPCIDAGDPMTPIGLEPFPNGGIINMGAYGGTSEASKSYFGKPSCETIVAGDINGDCKVNFLDFWLMALHWLEER